MTWKWIVGPAAGGYTDELTEARGRKATFRLTEPSTTSCSIDGRHEQARLIDELSTDLHVLRDGKQLLRARVGSTTDDGDDTSHAVAVNAFDYRELLRRRLLYADSTLMYAGADQADIVWALVSDTQARTGGHLGIARGRGTSTGRRRDRTYEPGNSIGSRIDELAAVIDGFDWDVLPTTPSALSLDVFYPQRGTDRGEVLDYGRAVARFQRTVDPREYANAGRYSGGEGTTAVTREAPDLASRAEGRWDTQQGDTDLKQQPSLEERADALALAARTLSPSYSVELADGWWEGPAHIWLGDTCRVVVYSGRLAVDTPLRVVEVAADIGDSGEERISLSLGAPPLNYARRQREQAARLTTLERR